MNTQIVATVGPASLKPDIMFAYKQRGVNYIRLNLSHTPEDEIEEKIKQMVAADIPVMIDTEGSQVRTGHFAKGSITVQEGETLKIYHSPDKNDPNRIYIRPKEALNYLEVGSLISIQFHTVVLKVKRVDSLMSEGFIETEVIIGGTFGSNKAIIFDCPVDLSPYSMKDFKAVEIAKDYQIKHFTLSYIRTADEVSFLRKMYSQAVLITKVETKAAVENFDEILHVSDGILIDRGDLSEEVPSHSIPIIQKIIIRKCREANKPVYVATNILESMADENKPNRSEVSDIVNTIFEGVNGLILTKESAVGKYPVETVNVLRSIIKHTEIIQSQQVMGKKSIYNDLSFINQSGISSSLIEPHGGELVNRFRVEYFSQSDLLSLPRVEVSDETLMDLEQIAFGVYSPLKGFMKKLDLTLVLESMRLPNGLPWTMPIILTVHKKIAQQIKVGEHIALTGSDGQIYATMKVDEVYEMDKLYLCDKWFGTTDMKHPGVKNTFELGEFFLGGEINLVQRRPSEHKRFELTPMQTRKIFEDKGWSIVVGFHTRNAIHRSHEYIQLEAMRRVGADGLFVHPVVGKKKKGDFEAPIIIKAYEVMMQKFYPKGKVVMGVYSTYSRYAGPREAVFTALCRKNYGCSHFIVGRDHTGVGDFYSPWASHEIFAKFPDLGIQPVFFKKIAYSKKLNDHVEEVEENGFKPKELAHISGTQAREMLLGNKLPPDWFMRNEVASMILAEKKKGTKVFVE